MRSTKTHPSLQMDHISCEVREASLKMQDHHFDMEPPLFNANIFKFVVFKVIQFLKRKVSKVA